MSRSFVGFPRSSARRGEPRPQAGQQRRALRARGLSLGPLQGGILGRLAESPDVGEL